MPCFPSVAENEVDLAVVVRVIECALVWSLLVGELEGPLTPPTGIGEIPTTRFPAALAEVDQDSRHFVVIAELQCLLYPILVLVAKNAGERGGPGIRRIQRRHGGRIS
jgi:hypothetical protein